MCPPRTQKGTPDGNQRNHFKGHRGNSVSADREHKDQALTFTQVRPMREQTPETVSTSGHDGGAYALTASSDFDPQRHPAGPRLRRGISPGWWGDGLPHVALLRCSGSRRALCCRSVAGRFRRTNDWVGAAEPYCAWPWAQEGGGGSVG